jgi:hypothetical protein
VVDLFPTFAQILGAAVPKDRIVDGVDQLDFLLGRQEASNREAVIVYVGSELYGIQWRNYKIMSKEIDRAFADPTRVYGVPLIYDLHTDPREEHPLHSQWYHVGWIRWPASEHLRRHLASLEQEPPIPPGTPDPYAPGRRQGSAERGDARSRAAARGYWKAMLIASLGNSSGASGTAISSGVGPTRAARPSSRPRSKP